MRPTRQRGFTMLEVLVASTILIVVLGIAFTATQRVSTHAKLGALQSYNRTLGRNAIAKIARELEQSSARRIFREDTPGSGTFAKRTPLTAADGVVTNVQFQVCTGFYTSATLPAPNPDKLEPGDPKYDAALHGCRWDQVGKKLFALIPGGGETLMLDGVSSFGVSFDASGGLTVSLAMETRDPDNLNGAPIRVFETALMTAPMNPK